MAGTPVDSQLTPQASSQTDALQRPPQGVISPSPREERVGRGPGRGAAEKVEKQGASSPRPSPPLRGGEGEDNASAARGRLRPGRIQFRVATADDDAAIRRLLRENPMPGEITLSFEREPDYFLGAKAGTADDRTIVAFENGRLICLGRCSVRPRFVNGEVRRVGYLSDLRLDAAAQGRFDVLRRGYQFFHELQGDNPADFYFTSIAADNARSIRFLERGLPGMPAYDWLADFVTLLVPVPRGAVMRRRRAHSARARLEANRCDCVSGTERSGAEIVACLNAQAKQHPLAAAWTASDLQSFRKLGLTPADFRLVLEGTKVVAAAALWDQRGFKQTVIRGYSPKLALSRRYLNFAAALFGTPGLPALGSTLAHGFLSPLAVDAARGELLLALVEQALADAADRGLDFITIGFASDDPRLALLRSHFRCREYRSRLYQVSWTPHETTYSSRRREEAEVGEVPLHPPPHVGGYAVFPEVALL